MPFIEMFKDATIGFSGYRRLLRRSASGFGYFATLLLVVLAIAGIIATVNARHQMAAVARSLQSAPDFALQNGEVTFSGQMPYRLETGNGAFLIVDTTGATTADVLKSAPAGSMLITKTDVHAVQATGQLQSVNLRQFPVSVTKQDVIRLAGAAHWLVVIGYILLYPLQLGFKALDACVLALAVMAYGTSRRQPVPFDQGFKAGLYGMTLPTVIQWLWPGFSVLTWTGFILWWAVAMLYAILGTRAYLEAPDDWHEVPPV